MMEVLMHTFFKRFCSLVLLTTALTFAGQIQAQEKLSFPTLPEDLNTFAIGEQLTVNGLPMRLRGFVSPLPVADLLQSLRRSLGMPLVESRIGNKYLLGRRMGSYYFTAQVEATALAQGSRGTLAVTDLRALAQRQPELRHCMAALRDRLPTGSRITNDMQSEEMNKSACHMVIANNHSEERNRDALVALMSQDGYRLERETAPDLSLVGSASPTFASAKTLYFTAPGKEAMAIITRSDEKTMTVLNTQTITREMK
jgi:hypothetical protein